MNRSHLHVVPKSNPKSERDVRSQPRLSQMVVPSGHQFTLPLDGQNQYRQIFIVPMDEIHGRRLCNLIVGTMPKTVIDLRHVIRFDLPGSNRKKIFRCLETSNSQYTRLPISWHLIQAQDIMSGKDLFPDQLTQEIIKQKETPTLMLVASKIQTRLLITFVSQVISSCTRSPCKIEEIV